MARTVQDVALLLSALAGPDPRSPIALSEPGERFRADLERDFSGVRVAFSQDLGSLPVDPQVRAVVEGARDVLRSMACEVQDGEPDFHGADQAFKVWRAWALELAWGHLLQDHRHEMKDTVVWNIEEGQRITGPQIAAAERERSALYQRVRSFLEDFDFLVLPVSQVPPFDVHQRSVERIEDVAMETYFDWMKSCYFISVTGLPAISVPCGFTSDGLPVGVQIVGRHQDDFGVLQLAYAYQEATGVWRRPPTLTGIRAASEPTR